ncbi:MAG: sulfatase-like hydrolase/transferase, partial [bacterium]
ALHYNTWIADRTIAFLEEAARGGKPFFASASFPDPHHPFATPDPWFSQYDRAAIPLPVRREGELEDLAPHFAATHAGPVPTSGRHGATKMSDDQVREIIAITWGMVSFVDEQAGRILDALRRLKLDETTAVVFMSDHGDMLGDHWLMNKGPFHFDGLLKVPLIWRVPSSMVTRTPGGRVNQSLVSHLDFVPTVCELAGVPAPEYGPPAGTTPQAGGQLRPLPGRSLVPLLDGSAERVQDAVVIENDEDYLGLRLRTLVTEAHQLTIYVGEDGDEPYGELFDLARDPAQVHNLWLDPAAQALKSRLKSRLLAELVRTDSRLPRRTGHA